jgi:pectin methylesterase-like acyl-CoA thioesterase
MIPDLDITADETEKTATREIPAEIPAGFPVGMCHVVVPDSGDSDGLHFASLQEAIEYAIGNNAAATIYHLVEAGRVESRLVFVPAE